MSAVNYINNLSKYLVGVIIAGGIFMAGLQALKMTMAGDETEIARAKKNIKTIIIAVIIGLSVTSLIKTLFVVI